MEFYPELKNYIRDNLLDLEIGGDRKKQLAQLSSYIASKHATSEPAKLVFICTHNSRRSHISQIWCKAAADYFGIPGIHCFSGGTEETAFNYRAIDALRRAGFRIESLSRPGIANPTVAVHYSPYAPAIKCFSKVYDDPINPKENFGAVMTCSDADANCPFIPGATRISLPYDDPKQGDSTPGESAGYDARVLQIGQELMYLMSTLSNQP